MMIRVNPDSREIDIGSLKITIKNIIRKPVKKKALKPVPTLPVHTRKFLVPGVWGKPNTRIVKKTSGLKHCHRRDTVCPRCSNRSLRISNKDSSSVVDDKIDESNFTDDKPSFDFDFSVHKTELENLILGSDDADVDFLDLSSVPHMQETDFLVFNTSQAPIPSDFLPKYDQHFKNKIISKAKRHSIDTVCEKYKLDKDMVKTWISSDTHAWVARETKRINKKLVQWVMERFFIDNRVVLKSELILEALRLRISKRFNPTSFWYCDLIKTNPQIYDKIVDDSLMN